MFELSLRGYRLQGLAVHPDAFGFLAAIVAVISFCAQPSRPIWLARVIALLSLLATDSRTALLSMSFGLFLFWVLGPGWHLHRRVLAIVSAALATPFAWLFIDIHRVGGNSPADVLSGRSLIWAAAAHLATQVGVLGDGPETIARRFFTLLGPYTTLYQAQNQWVNEAVNFGYFETALLGLLLFSFLFVHHRTYRYTVLLPLVGMFFVESLSEIPIDFWASIIQAFPFFLLLLLSPRRPRLPSVTMPPTSPSPTTVQHPFGLPLSAE
jgi:hypothetical protein